MLKHHQVFGCVLDGGGAGEGAYGIMPLRGGACVWVAALGAQAVKNLPAVQETQVQCLD